MVKNSMQSNVFQMEPDIVWQMNCLTNCCAKALLLLVFRWFQTYKEWSINHCFLCLLLFVLFCIFCRICFSILIKFFPVFHLLYFVEAIDKLYRRCLLSCFLHFFIQFCAGYKHQFYLSII